MRYIRQLLKSATPKVWYIQQFEELQGHFVAYIRQSSGSRAVSLHTVVKVGARRSFCWSPRTIALHIFIKISPQRPFHNIHASKFRPEGHLDGYILQNYCPRTILLHTFRKVADGGPLSGVLAGVLSQRSWFCRFQECYPRDFEAMGMATCRSSTLL